MEVYEMEEYLTAKQVAKYLQVKPLTVYQWARTNKIPAVKIGRIWRFKRNVIDNFLEKKSGKKNR
jgi:excisionase family DNA binding protein